MTEPTFSDLLADRATAPRGQCPLCGSKPTAGTVRLALCSYGPERQLKGGRILATRSRSLCEPCLVRAYQALDSMLVTGVLPGS